MRRFPPGPADRPGGIAALFRATILAGLALPVLAHPTAAQEPAGAIVGQVVDRTAERPVAGVTVRLVDPSLATRAEGEAGPDGVFGFRVDEPGSYLVTAEAEGIRSATEGPFEIAPGDTAEVQIRVQATDSSRIAGPSAGSQTATLSGRLLDAGSGEPLSSATVILRPEGRRAVTDDRGRFRFDSVPAAGHELEVEHLGYEAASAGVETRPGRATHVRMEVAPDAVELPPVSVTVEHRPRYLENMGYYRRQRRHSGTFIGPDEMEEAPPAPGMKAFLDREVSGLTMQGDFLFATRALGQPSVEGRCNRAAVFVDGRWSYFLDNVRPEEVDAVEVYTSAAAAPVQFTQTPPGDVANSRGRKSPEVTADPRCGVILIWTR